MGRGAFSRSISILLGSSGQRSWAKGGPETRAQGPEAHSRQLAGDRVRACVTLLRWGFFAL